MAKKRILQEMKELKNTDIEGITAGPVSESNIFEWTATLAGPKDSGPGSFLWSCVRRSPPWAK